MENQVEEIKFLIGKRVYLRPIMEKDIPLFAKWMNDREVTQFLVISAPITEIAERKWFEEKAVSSSDVILSIVLNDGVVIGIIELGSINWKDGTGTSGCVIGEKEYWGKGFGTEAKMLFLNYIFNNLGIRKVNSNVISNNPRSLEYQKKCGGKKEGVKKKQILKDGVYHDEIIIGTFKKDFQKKWEEMKDNILP